MNEHTNHILEITFSKANMTISFAFFGNKVHTNTNGKVPSINTINIKHTYTKYIPCNKRIIARF